MAVLFSESKTKQNLMRAFAGEGQARNRYTFAAEQARKEGKPAVADIFLYTADPVSYTHLTLPKNYPV